MGCRPRIRKSLDWARPDEFRHKDDLGIIDCGNLQDANATDLEFAAQFIRSGRGEMTVHSFDNDLIVGDEGGGFA